MRVGVDGRVLTDHYPGIGWALYAVLPSLAREVDDIVLIRGPEPESDRFPISKLADCGVTIHDVTVGLRSVVEQARLPAEVRSLRLDVVLTPYFATALWWPCPRVTVVHDLIPLTVKSGMSSRTARLGYRLLLLATLARSQMIVVPSQATADSLCRVAPRVRSRIWVIPHAFDARTGPTDRSETEEVGSRYRLGSRFVLAVAGDRPHKNLSRLIVAWTALDPADKGEAVLALAGSPSPRVDEPTIRVLGAVPDHDLAALYTGASVVVVPSLEEGFGLPVAEALSCGTAVVCSDRPALRELAGDAALFFDPFDAAQIAETLVCVLSDNDLRRRLGERGPGRVKRLAPDLVAARLVEPLRAAAHG